MAIGSSNCIHCPSNNKLALLTIFAVSGILIVLFISVLNLTVTQGIINGLVFYANIVWEHQSIASQQDIRYTGVFLKPFIAWFNLDFGIETCFIKGLDAYTKTWLQFLFPLYLWTIAGLVIIAARYSTKVTNLVGNRAVHTLSTLFFVSYAKLFRIVKETLHLTPLTTVYKNGTAYTGKVWIWDGDIRLFDSKYLPLFLAAVFMFVFLWVPYTVMLTCVQPLRKISHYRCCRWIAKLNPIYDAYLAPLKNTHQYLFGVLLLTRGFLLMVILAPSRGLNLHNLMIVALLTLILIYMAITQPYRSKVVLILQCISFGNLIILVGVISYLKLESRMYKYWVIATTVSTTLAFVQFCIIVLWSGIKVYLHNFRCLRRVCQCSGSETEEVCGKDVGSQHYTSYYRDSILDFLQ